MKQHRKDKRLTFRVTPEQYQRITAAAEAADMTPAAYARAATLHQQVKVFPGLEEITVQLKRIGVNLNQLTVLSHEGRIQAVHLDETVKEFQRLYDPLYIISNEAWH